MSEQKGLGRGIGALLVDDTDEKEDDKLFLCDINKIDPNPSQPRSYFDPEKLSELSDSIKEKGIIQPLLVAKAIGNRYKLIAGERRLKAAKIAALDEVPVIVMEADSDNEQLELALIENIQRHDLNAIEEALAYQRLIADFNLTQEEVAKKVSKKRSSVTNILRLLKLPDKLQTDVIENKISEGHARALLRLQDDPDAMMAIRDRIVKDNLSVRETERICKAEKGGRKKRRQERYKAISCEEELPESYCNSLTNQVSNFLKSKVDITQNGSRGKLEIEYYSADDLERLVNLLGMGIK
jgi:ParB family chromosome partitioning protein